MDQFIFHLINQQWTSPALDLFMAALSDSTIWKPLFVAIGLSAVLFGGFRARAFVVCLVLSLLITDQVTNGIAVRMALLFLILGGSRAAEDQSAGEVAHA